MADQGTHYVAVIGAGPAGLFAARELAQQGVQVVLFNRDIKPGGLAEYGIYPDKHKMKEGLRAQFRQILALDNVHYFGNVMIAENGDLSRTDLRQLGFQAMLVTTGAQGTKWLGLPGEHLKGVFHAKDIVYHYNLLPPYSQREYPIGQRVALIGVGNVMLDVARFLISMLHVEEVVAIARRGPDEVKFDKKELESMAAYLDMPDLQAEVERVLPAMQAIGQEPTAFWELIHAAQAKMAPPEDGGRLRLRFLYSPTRILSSSTNDVLGLEVEENSLALVNGEVKARGTGTTTKLDVDTVIFAIGDQVDEAMGLPIRGSEFVKAAEPRFPVEGISYEVYEPLLNRIIPDVFVAGWARQASTGLVGIARKDGTNGARAVLQYLASLPTLPIIPLQSLETRLEALGKPVVTATDIQRLTLAEQDRAVELGLEEFRFHTNRDMLRAMGK